MCLCRMFIMPATRGPGKSSLYVLNPPVLAQASYAAFLKIEVLCADFPPCILHQDAACSLFRHAAQVWQLQMALKDTFSKFVTCRPTCNLVPVQIQLPYVLKLTKAKHLAAFEPAAYSARSCRLTMLETGEDLPFITYSSHLDKCALAFTEHIVW